jgi:predicted metal-dependent phosphoesterase TrpH
VSEAITQEKRRRELANRVSNGIEVSLCWGPVTGEVVVEVIDHGAEQVFEFSVPSGRALDAFHHPYAYASRQGVEYEALLPQAA